MNTQSHSQTQSPARSGVTLTEVLMSLMIMGIGVTAVATLFPIAALRSAQATRLTSATILRENVEAQLQAQPWLVYDPNLNGDFNEHMRRPIDRRYIVDPLGAATIAGFNDAAHPSNQFGSFPSALPLPLPRFSAGIPIPDPADVSIPRLIAARVSGLGDGWDTSVDTLAEDVVLSNGRIIGVELPDGEDLTSLMDVDNLSYANAIGLAPNLTRVTVFSVNGRLSESYPVREIPNGQSLVWSDTTGNGPTWRPLPPVFGGQIGRVVVQTKRLAEFNWLLTVRRSPDGRVSGLDVVVMFSEGREPFDESLYEATFIRGTNLVGLRIPTAVLDDVVIKRGGFIFDSENARWYRISDFQKSSTEFLPTYNVIVEVENEVLEASGEDQFEFDSTNLDTRTRITLNGVINTVDGISEDRDGDGTLDYGHAMFLPSVVEVFALGSFPVPSEILPTNF